MWKFRELAIQSIFPCNQKFENQKTLSFASAVDMFLGCVQIAHLTRLAPPTGRYICAHITHLTRLAPPTGR